MYFFSTKQIKSICVSAIFSAKIICSVSDDENEIQINSRQFKNKLRQFQINQKKKK